MALQTLNIDDRNYDQLLEELKQHIPVSKWTDHHPSDPGIMLLELFAWLGEMALYRMNRVPDTHIEKFLKLIIDPPEPVTVTVELGFVLSDTRSAYFEIPLGIRFATDFKDGERYVFETFQITVIPAPAKSKVSKGTIKVNTRCWKQVIGEEVGKSDGTANQTFPLKHAPVLLDFVNSSAVYKPNPVVHVKREELEGEEWQLKPFLLTEESKAGDAKHFMVDGYENIVRFGDNNYGSIPPPNATITCSYRVMQGKEALIKAGELKHVLDPIPGLEPGETISINGNDDAMSDLYFLEKKEEQVAKGLENFKKPYRLITAEDFEDALMTDFNQLQDLTRENTFNQLPDIARDYDMNTLRERSGEDDFELIVENYFHPDNLPQSLYKICRASALMNREYIESSKQLVQKTGHVTLLVIPEFNPDIPDTQNEIEVPGKLKDKILLFLEKRRLITTKLHIMPAKLKRIRIKIKAVIYKELSTYQMEDTIRKHINDFMDILTGGLDQKGWPAGRSLYKSHLYRLVEGIDGVDYVETLTFSPAADENCIPLGENELPLLQSLDVYLERG